MKREWISIGLIVGLLAAAITGGAVLNSGGDGAGGDGTGKDVPDAEMVIVKDGDISVQSIENTEVGTGEPDELAERVAEILGTDTQATHDAMVQADQIDASRIRLEDPAPEDTDEESVDSMSAHSEGLSYMEYGNRIGEILGLDGEKVARAIAQAYQELYAIERDIWDNGSGRDAEGKYDSDKNPAEPAA